MEPSRPWCLYATPARSPMMLTTARRAAPRDTSATKAQSRTLLIPCTDMGNVRLMSAAFQPSGIGSGGCVDWGQSLVTNPARTFKDLHRQSCVAGSCPGGGFSGNRAGQNPARRHTGDIRHALIRTAYVALPSQGMGRPSGPSPAAVLRSAAP